jgi:heptaprenyl diphosphate synthase
MALVLHYIEHFFPPLAPGAKLGLANIVTMITCTFLDFLKPWLWWLFAPFWAPCWGAALLQFCTVWQAGCSAALLWQCLYFKFSKYFSLMGISVAGAVFP